MSAPIRLAVIGGAGRMGQAISRAADARQEFAPIARVARGEPIGDTVRECDVVIDVSHAAAIADVCAACVANRKPLVIGTTGHNSTQLQTIRDASKSIAIVLAPNFSVGINALVWLAGKTAELLGDTFDIEIVESHHRMKKDAPSGTAKQIAHALCEARALNYDDAVVDGRSGVAGERPRGQIGIHAIRGGDVIGEHTVIFAGDGERLELTHRASNRDTFAVGALRGARWIVHAPAGLHTMQDVLGIAAQQ